MKCSKVSFSVVREDKFDCLLATKSGNPSLSEALKLKTLQKHETRDVNSPFPLQSLGAKLGNLVRRTLRKWIGPAGLAGGRGRSGVETGEVVVQLGEDSGIFRLTLLAIWLYCQAWI